MRRSTGSGRRGPPPCRRSRTRARVANGSSRRCSTGRSPGSTSAVSVALLDDGPLAGAVAAPAFDDVLSARRGTAPVRGSLDADADEDVPVGPTARDDLDGAAVLVEGEPPDGLAGTLAGAGEIRRLGSPALALAHVAAGRADACLLTDVDAATVAGGYCLLDAASGQVTTPDGEPLHLRGVDAGDRVSLLASNGSLHEALLATR
ncbi:hypothetical protein BRC73_01490 [Halobacteriales archaeon QH_7_66_37]|nr:MAG: hypothetical protein BRC73_01490 [Halobacteriales archaeon QH_7_66_37]